MALAKTSDELRRSGAYKKHPERENKREPRLESGRPVKPRGLDAVTSKEWDSMIAHLESMSVLTPQDGKHLLAYCQTEARRRRAHNKFMKTGDLKYAREADAATGLCYRLLQGFGMTSASRKSVSTVNEQSDPFTELMAAREAA